MLSILYLSLKELRNQIDQETCEIHVKSHFGGNFCFRSLCLLVKKKCLHFEFIK